VQGERGSEATEQRLGSEVRLSNEMCSLMCGTVLDQGPQVREVRYLCSPE
jgi:hypothetical protein